MIVLFWNINRRDNQSHIASIVSDPAHPVDVIVLAESGVGVAVVDPLSPLFSGHYNLAVRAFEPACQVSASVVHSRKRPLSRAAEAFLREVRVAVGEVAERLA